MKKIKETLIHWLGGVTEDESQEAFNEGYIEGKRIATSKPDDNHNFHFARGYNFARKQMLEYANDLYGLPAEEWCQKLYEFLSA